MKEGVAIAHQFLELVDMAMGWRIFMGRDNGKRSRTF